CARGLYYYGSGYSDFW
nr:immunoglobulin heavy chain junction region [Mus musculus]MBK4185899.1 immunoglobulin heavy chain junction region [Mus musculus]MBK4185908.1 immunoglobulin heavy chain junction region [Mus musculus]